jgi:TPR repeat protein
MGFHEGFQPIRLHSKDYLTVRQMSMRSLVLMSALLGQICLWRAAGAQDRPGTGFYDAGVKAPGVCAASGANFMTERQVEDLVSEMLDRIGTRNRYIIVSCREVENCQATIYRGKPYILYNPQFLGAVKSLNFSTTDLRATDKDWQTLTILAHELGHHINNHLLNPLPDATQRDMELEADETAGFIIYLMGGPVEKALQAYATLSEQGTYLHPPRTRRLEAVQKGFASARQKYPRYRQDDAEVRQAIRTAVALHERRKYRESYRILSRDDLKDDAQVQYYLGRMYYFGYVFQRDTEEALRLFRLSAEKGFAIAQNNLGWMHVMGEGVTKDAAEGLRWLRKAADQGLGISHRNLAIIHQLGLGVRRDPKEADFWYRKAAESLQQEVDRGGWPEMTFLGEMFLKGLGIPRDSIRAMRLFARSADSGYTRAMVFLGDAQLSTKTRRGDSIALTWYRKAVSLEDPQGQFRLGNMLMSGTGVRPDTTEAVRLFRKSAEGGEPNGMAQLAYAYQMGAGLGKDPEEALRLYRQAADKGNTFAMNSLGYLYETGSGIAKDIGQSIQWYRMSAERDDPWGQWALGNRYLRGAGVTKDPVEALRLCRLAAAQGQENAMADIGYIFENGLGVGKDAAEAIRWYRRAADNGNVWAREQLVRLKAR